GTFVDEFLRGRRRAEAPRSPDAATGAFVDEFLPHNSGRLNQPASVVIGPRDHNVYVSTGHFGGPGQIKAVLRYDGTTGAFLRVRPARPVDPAPRRHLRA